MKTLYLDCSLGASAQGIASALFGLWEDKESMIGKLNNMGLQGVRFSYEEEGSSGCLLSVEIEEAREDRKEASLSQIVDSLSISKAVKESIRYISQSLSDASGEDIKDRGVIPILACTCFLMEELKPDKLSASSVCMGKGPIVREGKILRVPSPATASLLKGIPVYAGDLAGELCTPQAAAILKFYVDRFESIPLMSMTDISYGKIGSCHQELCLAAYLGESRDTGEDSVCLIHTNLDDMTGEAIGFAQEMIWECGALDVYVTPIQMKKNRPGVQLSCICREEDKEACIDAFLRYTTTLGVRYEKMERRTLSRTFSNMQTEQGGIRIKKSFSRDITKVKAEYEDLCRIAREKKISLKEAERTLI